MTAADAIDTTNSQTQECWVGTSWGVVAGMVQERPRARGGPRSGRASSTPSGRRTPSGGGRRAWQVAGQVRAPYYMRATTLWAVKHAYDISQ